MGGGYRLAYSSSRVGCLFLAEKINHSGNAGVQSTDPDFQRPDCLLQTPVLFEDYH